MAPPGVLTGIRRRLWGLFALLLLAGATVLVIDELAQVRGRQTLVALQDMAGSANAGADRLVREELARQQRLTVLRIGVTFAVLLLVAWRGQRVLRDLYGRTRAEVAAAETELTEQLARNEAVRTELARRELFQRSLLEAAQVAIMAIDHEGRWSVFNPAAERLLGWRADEVVGRLVRYGDPRPGDAPLLVTPTQVEDTAAWLGQKLGRHVPNDWRALYALADLRQPPAEARMLHRDGREVPVLLALSAFDDAQGQRAGMIAVAADLTRIKRLERDLRESKARAQAANQAKSAFLATMSH